MNHELPLLDQIDVASPCSASWDEMQGDDRVRYCGQCELHVYNLSGMQRQEAEDVVRSHEGRLCVRFYRREDGTILTRDCPVGLAAIRRRLVRALAGTCALLAALCGGTVFASLFSRHKPAGYQSPQQAFANWIDPDQGHTAVAGKMVFLGGACPPPALPSPPSNVGSGE